MAKCQMPNDKLTNCYFLLDFSRFYRISAISSSARGKPCPMASNRCWSTTIATRTRQMHPRAGGIRVEIVPCQTLAGEWNQSTACGRNRPRFTRKFEIFRNLYFILELLYKSILTKCHCHQSAKIGKETITSERIFALRSRNRRRNAQQTRFSRCIDAQTEIEIESISGARQRNQFDRFIFVGFVGHTIGRRFSRYIEAIQKASAISHRTQ